MSRNIRPNMTMIALKDLINILLYKECNISIHSHWNSLFALHMQSSSNLDVHINIEDNSNEDNFEDECEDFPSETLVHNFLDLDKIYDFGSLISIAPYQEYFPLGIFKNKYSEELNYPILFYGHLRDERFKKLSYHEIANWEILHKSHDFDTNIQNIYF